MCYTLFLLHFNQEQKKISIHNLPASIAGSKVPFDETVLRRGMSLQINYNGTILRRGIVFLAPSSSPHFMWWQSKTRFVTGEVPVCHSLLHNIEEIRWASLTLEPVPQFDLWFTKLPFAMKILLDHPTRAQQRGPRPLKTNPPSQTSPTPKQVENTSEKKATWPLEFEIHSPPCEFPTFVSTQSPSNKKERSDNDKPRVNTTLKKNGEVRKVRSDKNTRRGKNQTESLAMSGHSVSPPDPPRGASLVEQLPALPTPPIHTGVGSLDMHGAPPPPHLLLENPAVDYLVRVLKAIKDVPGAPGM